MSEEKGLFGKYKISKTSGEPISDKANYFILRHDSFGDHCHVEASRKALAVYADEIEEYIPELANDIKEMLNKYE